MFIMVAAITLTAAPPEDVLPDRCDIIELNHLYNGEGDHVFSQWIFWRWETVRRGGVNEGRER